MRKRQDETLAAAILAVLIIYLFAILLTLYTYIQVFD